MHLQPGHRFQFFFALHQRSNNRERLVVDNIGIWYACHVMQLKAIKFPQLQQVENQGISFISPQIIKISGTESYRQQF